MGNSEFLSLDSLKEILKGRTLFVDEEMVLSNVLRMLEEDEEFPERIYAELISKYSNNYRFAQALLLKKTLPDSALRDFFYNNETWEQALLKYSKREDLSFSKVVTIVNEWERQNRNDIYYRSIANLIKRETLTGEEWLFLAASSRSWSFALRQYLRNRTDVFSLMDIYIFLHNDSTAQKYSMEYESIYRRSSGNKNISNALSRVLHLIVSSETTSSVIIRFLSSYSKFLVRAKACESSLISSDRIAEILGELFTFYLENHIDSDIFTEILIISLKNPKLTDEGLEYALNFVDQKHIPTLIYCMENKMLDRFLPSLQQIDLAEANSIPIDWLRKISILDWKEKLTE